MKKIMLIIFFFEALTVFAETQSEEYSELLASKHWNFFDEYGQKEAWVSDHGEIIFYYLCKVKAAQRDNFEYTAVRFVQQLGWKVGYSPSYRTESGEGGEDIDHELYSNMVWTYLYDSAAVSIKFIDNKAELRITYMYTEYGSYTLHYALR